MILGVTERRRDIPKHLHLAAPSVYVHKCMVKEADITNGPPPPPKQGCSTTCDIMYQTLLLSMPALPFPLPVSVNTCSEATHCYGYPKAMWDSESQVWLLLVAKY